MMPSASEALSVIWTCVYALLAFIVWGAYCSYRRAAFREELFTIRDELFEYAANGCVGFDDPAYGMLRTMLNGFIRFGHRIDGFALVLYTVKMAHARREPPPSLFMRRWDHALRTLDDDQQTTLNDMLRRVHVAVLEQMVLGSFVLASGALVFLVASRVRDGVRMVKRRVNPLFGHLYDEFPNRIAKRLVRPLDDVAYSTGSIDRDLMAA